LIPLSQDDGEQFVLFTRRTETVEHHKGQISFPGGAVEPGDPDLLSTAVRETGEELGIPPNQIRILGELDDVNSRISGFVITPFVGQIPHHYPLTVSQAEIAEVLVVPLATFRDPRNLRVETIQRGSEQAEIFFYHYDRHEIWGLTAQIMKRMVDVVFGGEGP
jgi:8-oxo-dGTP pyrophosphatase MutT (NUDIX family)